MVTHGIRESTKKTYTSVQTKFLKFCEMHELLPVPVDECTILRYIAYLQSQPGRGKVGLSHSSVQVHLSGIRALQVVHGNDTSFYTSKVKWALRSIELKGPPPVRKIPITFDILEAFLLALPPDYDGLMWASVINLGYYGAFRGSEYTVVTLSQGIMVSQPLSVQAVTFGNYKGQKYMKVSIPQTKTSHIPVVKSIGCSKKSNICAVCSMWKYLTRRKEITTILASSPLFVTWDNKIVTKAMLNLVLKNLAAQVGVDPAMISSHSLRCGAATNAANNSMQEKSIARLGLWRSNCYQNYIRDAIQQQIQQVHYLDH